MDSRGRNGLMVVILIRVTGGQRGGEINMRWPCLPAGDTIADTYMKDGTQSIKHHSLIAFLEGADRRSWASEVRLGMRATCIKLTLIENIPLYHGEGIGLVLPMI